MKEELYIALLAQLADLTEAVRRLEVRMPPLTAAQRSARSRESRRSHARETQLSEEKVTHGVTRESRTEAPSLPVPSLLSPPPILPPFIPPSLEKPKALSSEMLDVFDEWKRVMGKPNAQFTPERERKVRARLKDYPKERLFAAIAGCKRSPHHQGQNDTGAKYDDLELICRDGKHVEMFEGMTSGAPSRNGAALQISPKLAEATPGRKFL